MAMKQRPIEPVRAGGILLMCQDQFLLMRHRDRWDLPKGHCEAGENFSQTALRETEEETGIPAANITLDPNFVFQIEYPVTYKRWGTLQKQVRYFLGFIDQKPELVLTEHESADWFAWDPPHRIQAETIDPLLEAVDRYRKRKHLS
jgi:8-oxo-dGTP pyrophosphatase MutT (NUDIX family)